MMLLFSAPLHPQSAITPSLFPKLGDTLPCIPVDSVRWLIASGQMAQGCDVIYSGIKFFIATIDGKQISFISTRDSNFVSPDGIRVGDNIKKIRAVKGTEIIPEIGWSYYSILPSGWCTRYPGIPEYEMHHITSVSKDSVVFELFQRK